MNNSAMDSQVLNVAKERKKRQKYLYKMYRSRIGAKEEELLNPSERFAY